MQLAHDRTIRLNNGFETNRPTSFGVNSNDGRRTVYVPMPLCVGASARFIMGNRDATNRTNQLYGSDSNTEIVATTAQFGLIRILLLFAVNVARFIKARDLEHIIQGTRGGAFMHVAQQPATRMKLS